MARRPISFSAFDGKKSLWRLLFEEGRVEVRTMDRDVALRACLEERRLVMERRSARRAAETRGGMALEAEQVDVAQP